MESRDTRTALTLAALFAQPDNAAVWRYLNARGPEDVRSFEAEADGSPYDEGGQIFFHRYGRLVPAAARCIVCVEVPENLLAHERTLDLRAGLLYRNAHWASPAGQQVKDHSAQIAGAFGQFQDAARLR